MIIWGKPQAPQKQRNNMENLETEVEYSEVVRLFESFLGRKRLQLQNLRELPEKYQKLDGLLCEKIVKYGCHRSAFRNVMSKHGQVVSQIWGIK